MSLGDKLDRIRSQISKAKKKRDELDSLISKLESQIIDTRIEYEQRDIRKRMKKGEVERVWSPGLQMYIHVEKRKR